ncbi:MAG TPA: sporulation integral membrane protein YtvI [Clostridia bacterium]|nr:sporulation integral membrane protein YtvI [Clostridia bacterium]
MVRLTSKAQGILKWLGIAILIILGLFLFFTRLIKYVAPFLIAFIVMISIEGLVTLLQRRLKFPRSPAVAVSLLLFVVVVGGILTFTFYRLTVEIWKLALELSRMDFNPIIDYFESMFEKGQDLFLSLPRGLADTIEESLRLDAPRLSKIATEVSTRLMGIVMGMVNFVKFLPDAVVFIIVTLISSYFMSRDRRQISEFLSKRFSPLWFDRMRSLRNDMLLALVGFIKAQMILMAITFLELLVGFQIIGVKYAFFFALITAVVDALPVLGTGTILIPTAIINFISGNVARGMGFLILYLIIFIIRQILEPKIVSQSLGLHPLVTLISMYAGLKFMGVAGMLLGPIIAIIVRAFYKAGLFPTFRAPQ